MAKEQRYRGDKPIPHLVEPEVIKAVYFTGARAESTDGTVHLTLWVEQRDFSETDGFQAVIVGRMICPHEAAISLGLSLQQTMADVLMRERERGRDRDQDRRKSGEG